MKIYLMENLAMLKKGNSKLATSSIT